MENKQDITQSVNNEVIVSTILSHKKDDSSVSSDSSDIGSQFDPSELVEMVTEEPEQDAQMFLEEEIKYLYEFMKNKYMDKDQYIEFLEKEIIRLRNMLKKVYKPPQKS